MRQTQMQNRTKKNWGKNGRKSGLSLILMTSKTHICERNQTSNFLGWLSSQLSGEALPQHAPGHEFEAPASPKEGRKEKNLLCEKQSRDWNPEPSTS